ncbi:MAG: peptide ABC transporter substrate-binding protein [Hyphomicrobiales bacterium]|nr:MAG: peptide ABC transporter substrate-binding protein [Hyphomicrobiales bacterium]
MKEKHLRRMIKAVGDGRVSRRTFIARMMAAGISAPLATQMLTYSGIAQAQTKFEYKPTKRGGGGPLKILYWQGPTLLNPHFAVGTKDQDGSRVFYEPLAGWDADGNLVPILAAEIPTVENGGLAKDGMWVVWKLKQGVQWHDGKPFTADDVVFNWEYAKDPATAATTIAAYKDIKVEKVDQYTVKVSFDKPTAVWAQAFVGIFGMIIPKHQFEAYTGAKSREAPANLKPVGTGPFKFVDFKPGDLVKGEINTNYHIANQPFFDTVEIKGGGDAVSAARAVIQTGEFDMAWNMQVEDEILLKLEQNGKGKIVIVEGGNIEHIGINFTDPWTEVDGERSSLKTKHPTLTDPAVRKALNLLVDRTAVEKFIYGRTGMATAAFVNKPDRYRSKKTFEFNIDKANKLLDEAGWAKGSDGIRAKDGKKLKFVFQTSINAPRQKTQAIIKQACQKAGIDLELKSIVASVFFSSDVGNPDTYSKFYTDIQMFTTTQPQPDPHEFLGQFVSTDVKSKDNKWQGRNYTRYQSAAFDKLYAAAGAELDPVKRAALLIEAHDQAIEDVAVIPVVYRPMVQATSLTLRALFSGWDSNLCGIASWYREA